MICMYLKIPKNFMRLIFLEGFLVVIYHLFVRENLNFLHNSQWITLPTQSRIILYSLCAYLVKFSHQMYLVNLARDKMTESLLSTSSLFSAFLLIFIISCWWFQAHLYPYNSYNDRILCCCWCYWWYLTLKGSCKKNYFDLQIFAPLIGLLQSRQSAFVY